MERSAIMKYSLFLLILAGLVSCKPETIDPCSPSTLSQLKFKGYTNICSGFPSQQEFFSTIATISAEDSILTINLSSLDTSIIFEQAVNLKYECVEGEEDLYAFELFQDDINVGLIGLSGVSLYVILLDSPCPNSSSFEGALVR